MLQHLNAQSNGNFLPSIKGPICKTPPPPPPPPLPPHPKNNFSMSNHVKLSQETTSLRPPTPLPPPPPPPPRNSSHLLPHRPPPPPPDVIDSRSEHGSESQNSHFIMFGDHKNHLGNICSNSINLRHNLSTSINNGPCHLNPQQVNTHQACVEASHIMPAMQQLQFRPATVVNYSYDQDNLSCRSTLTSHRSVSSQLNDHLICSNQQISSPTMIHQHPCVSDCSCPYHGAKNRNQHFPSNVSESSRGSNQNNHHHHHHHHNENDNMMNFNQGHVIRGCDQIRNCCPYTTSCVSLNSCHPYNTSLPTCAPYGNCHAKSSNQPIETEASTTESVRMCMNNEINRDNHNLNILSDQSIDSGSDSRVIQSSNSHAHHNFHPHHSFPNHVRHYHQQNTPMSNSIVTSNPLIVNDNSHRDCKDDISILFDSNHHQIGLSNYQAENVQCSRGLTRAIPCITHRLDSPKPNQFILSADKATNNIGVSEHKSISPENEKPNRRAVLTHQNHESEFDSLITSAHSHNLSNSSTTTHTSNAAVKQTSSHQIKSYSREPDISNINLKQFNQNQGSDQYFLSTAASTSSAATSLSSFNIQGTSEEIQPLWPQRNSNRINHHMSHGNITQATNINPPTALRSKRSSPNSGSSLKTTNNQNLNDNEEQALCTNVTVPIMTTTLIDTTDHNRINLPLPPKPNSPNISSGSSQLALLSNSPKRITRVTSQAGVQDPLPSSDIPPPLPPSNPGLLAAAAASAASPHQFSSLNSLIDKLQNDTTLTNSTSLTSNNRNQNIKFPHSVSITEGMKKLNLNTGSKTFNLRPNQQQQTNIRHMNQELTISSNEMGNYGNCSKCNNPIRQNQNPCKAMDRMFHAHCFTCCRCGQTLMGQKFYILGEKIYCEEDYKVQIGPEQLEQCAACQKPITDMILTALEDCYHPECFKCCVCDKSLDGVPFTIDSQNKIYCERDYHNIFSPRCEACKKPIRPAEGSNESIRVVSMDKDYHVECYRCHDCYLQLSDNGPSQAYPFQGRLLCQACHMNRVILIQAALTI